ncbi:MAG: protein-disulfide reductase DsbD family protein [Hyphomonadaceae bacterium]|nr:protein-disulfide reductase DsbD family protein [Hyphomonadaceae bacterium]
MMRTAILAAAMVAAACSAAAEPFRTPHMETELHSARAAVAPGETFTVVLRQTMAPGWHTYWRNPGDSGEPTELTWSAPAGFVVGDMGWPAPERLPLAGIMQYGYSGEALYPITLTAPASARPGESAAFTVDAYWLICADVCIPEEGVLRLSVPIAAQGADDPVWAQRAAAARAALPQPYAGEARITAGAPAILSVAHAGPVRDPYFYPFARDAVRHSDPQPAQAGAGGFSLALNAGAGGALGTAPLSGVASWETQIDGAWRRVAVEIAATPGPALPQTSGTALAPTAAAAVDAPPTAPIGLLAALAFAFLGGLILNVMPCVFPVLSLKALSLAQAAHAGEARTHSAFFFAGVMATFLALAGVLIALQQAGAAAGWGFQLQQPAIVAGLALLFFAIGLNLAGVFEVGGGQGFGARLAAQSGPAGAFFTGALAVVAASPCTAPFMAGALGFAATQPWFVSLGVFAALGAGFAAPMTALGFIPALQRALPRPGPWMERFKQVLAFPMFGAAVWLAWVLAAQTGPNGVMALLALATALAFLLVSLRWPGLWRAAGAATVLVAALLFWRPLTTPAAAPAAADATAALVSEPWSAERVTALQAEGRPVFVNFTAAWCITCQVNERGALSSARVRAAFDAANVAYLKGDWTNPDPAIAAELARHGRTGVPLYLYYPVGGAPRVLPQMLSEAALLRTLDQSTGGGQAR